ncbi:uncharacterized protein LOC119980872 isoform X4 [Tripterygium wilfordii]|uniref:uncharacterized protein LOC119980872 isoform X4 n=1 Tax=Tripterygium wilfordii TaxID=458696 RepID=UPI0018F80DCB|nr:uncharacterized protein LOC119980872 isoform X4 [Tripterygium wilfordii]
MYFSEGFEDSIDTYFNFDDDHDKESNSEGDSGWPKQVIINPLVGTQEIKYPISQHQAIHDQAAGPSSKKRKGTPLEDDDEKKKRKRAADKKSRDKKRADVEKTKEDLKTTKKKVEDLEIEKDSLNEKIKSTEQRLKNAATHIVHLQSLIERSNETNSSNQNHIQELEMEQKKLGQEENGQVGFVGDGRSIITGEIPFQSVMMTQISQIFQRMDAQETMSKTIMAQISQIFQRMDAVEKYLKGWML